VAIPPIPPIGSVAATAPASPAAAPGFGAAMQRGLSEVSALEHAADHVTKNVATGGGAQIADLMAATTKASVGVDLLVAVRNRAVEAYQEIMRLQV
jgi:flagellar hook-basal body complex protein FliE